MRADGDPTHLAKHELFEDVVAEISRNRFRLRERAAAPLEAIQGKVYRCTRPFSNVQ